MSVLFSGTADRFGGRLTVGFIIGLGLLAFAWFLRSQMLRMEKTVRKIRVTDTSTVAELKQLQGVVSGEIGGGAFRQPVELKGTVEANHPLRSELTEEACVYYRSRVVVEYERTYYTTDEKGNRTRRTATETRQVGGNETSIRFQLVDATGKIHINPTGADIDAPQLLNHYEPYQRGKKVGYLNVQLNLGGGGDHRILGYRFQEWVLRVDTPIYILGEVNDQENQLVVEKPQDTDQPYLISHKTETELVQEKQGYQRGFQIGWWASAAVGVIFILWQVFHR